MAVYGDVTHDSRVRREAASLARAGFRVTLLCIAAGPVRADLPSGVEVMVIPPARSSVVPGSDNPFFGRRSGHVRHLLLQIAWLGGYIRNLRSWGRMVADAALGVDVWHLHDLAALAAIMPHVRAGIPVVYDAHELFLETGTALKLPGFARRLLRRYERRLVRRAAALVTVNDAVAAVLARRYAPGRIEVVHNCPPRWTPPARRSRHLRTATGIPDDAPIVLYHGRLSVDRGIEQLVEAMQAANLEGSHLVLMGDGELDLDRFRNSGAGDIDGSRVHLLDPVTPDVLLEWISSADVGAMPIQPSTLNHQLSTPNKLFECLAAGIPVVASDVPPVRRIVIEGPEGELGRVCDPSSVLSIAAAIRSILTLTPSDCEELRHRCVAAAQTTWNWETESAKLERLYSDLCSSDAGRASSGTEGFKG